MAWCSPVVKHRLVSRRTSVRFCFRIPFSSSKIVVCGHCLETLLWQLMKHFNDSYRCLSQCRNTYGGDSIVLQSSSFPTSWDLGPHQYLFGDNSVLNQLNKHRAAKLALSTTKPKIKNKQQLTKDETKKQKFFFLYIHIIITQSVLISFSAMQPMRV